LFKGIPVDIHVHHWVGWLEWIPDSHNQDAEFIWAKLETYFPKFYWEMINMVFGCLGQIMANKSILSKSTVLEYVKTNNPAYLEVFEKEYEYYQKKKKKIHIWIILTASKNYIFYKINI